MSELKNIVVAGATGNIGPYIVSALVKHGFNVTALTRSSASTNSSPFDPAVRVVQTDYSDPASLRAALKGQDGVVAAFGAEGVPLQPQIIEAAIEVGVRRFLPSEFSFSPSVQCSPQFEPFLADKVAVLEVLKRKAAEVERFSYTIVACGAWIDWALTTFRGAGFDLPSRSAVIVDSGDAKFSGTYISTVGEAIAQVFKHPSETANREVKVSSITLSRNELLAALEAETGDKYKVDHVSAADEIKAAQEAFAKGDMMDGYVHIVGAEFFSDESVGNAVVAGEDNALLGVREVTAQDLAQKCVADLAAAK